jgi:uncharacterized protein
MKGRFTAMVGGGGALLVLMGALSLPAQIGRAPEQGVPNVEVDAENRAGIATALVLGPGKNLRDARKSFERAAAQGYAPAQANLAIFYVNGWGGAPQNYGAALYWLKAAALQGQPRAYTNLGILYLNGWGVNRNFEEALKDFRYAAEHGETGAMVDVGYMIEKGMGAARDEAGAVEWYRRAADRGDALGQNNLADSYLRGLGVPQSDALAAAWFQKAADQGEPAARIKLGFLYMVGRGVVKDPASAYGWILAASLAGDRRGDEYLSELKTTLRPEQLEVATRRAHELQAVRQPSMTETAFVQ